MENKSGVGSDTKRQGRLITAFLGLVLAAGYLYMAAQLPLGMPEQPGPGVFPLVVGAFMAAASLLLLQEQLAKGAGDGSMGFPRGLDLRRLVGFGSSIAVYVVLAGYFGNLVASFVMSLGMVRLIDPRSWRRVVITAAAIALASQVLFVLILDVPLPTGKLFQ